MYKTGTTSIFEIQSLTHLIRSSTRYTSSVPRIRTTRNFFRLNTFELPALSRFLLIKNDMNYKRNDSDNETNAEVSGFELAAHAISVHGRSLKLDEGSNQAFFFPIGSVRRIEGSDRPCSRSSSWWSLS